ncbi:Response regulator receiver domain-containing protein [Abditibacterium utsteinense]|uniref:Response regulator receiver domain-containing protein n=1 Tax=Abditibacterium utsteinense TaxID=1960156 RepID=A0A2S8STS0_9BACT|nr:response regulator [Abditibacterium utsteinense]PQV64190.1 Response regulator receiver domain-containing protein [Abditibacterium utsteinense]
MASKESVIAPRPAPTRIDILIAEDSPTQALKLQHILASRGYGVQLARNGQEALDYLLDLRKDPQVWQNFRPTMVISDIIMPNMTGCELCHHIKMDEELRQLPVILLTSLSDSREALRGLYSGADNLISKPYEAAFLLARIDDIMATLQQTGGTGSQKMLPITMDGQKYLVSGERLGSINSILTTYEMAVLKNTQLEAAQETIAQQAAELAEARRLIAQQSAEIAEFHKK